MSFYQYIINNNESNSVFWFKQTFDVELLHNVRVCSSKALRDVLKPELQNNYIKERIFRECFMEYFKHKLLQSQYDSPIR